MKVSTSPISKKVDTLIVGAGVIGLAIARAFANAGKNVLVLEKNKNIGEEGSFKNSAVIHAGLYYSQNSLKRRLCLEGKELLYDYCVQHQLPYKKIGKLVVIPNSAKLDDLKQLRAQAIANGVSDIEMLDEADLLKIEPQVRAYKAVYSPSTGIISGKALLENLSRDIEEAGGSISCDTAFSMAELTKDGFIVSVKNNHFKINCSQIINAAGLWAPNVATNIIGLPAKSIPQQYFAKGNYFKLNSSSSPFNHLIYPLPEQSGLGIHATVDLHGQVRFGPDVEWVKSLDYTVTASRSKLFYDAIRQYYPAIEHYALIPEFAGIRPKISPPEQQPQDFMIQSETNHGIKNLVNLYGMESPGLTSCLAVAKYVASLLR